MIFTLSFYIFSFFISYLDCTRYKIPNITLTTLFIFLIIFGLLEDQFNYISLVISIAILIFFVIILLISPKQILGGGDIKYLMVISIYLNPFLFPLFLICSGVIQMCFLIYFQKIKKRRVAPMAPAMFLAVFITELIHYYGIYKI